LSNPGKIISRALQFFFFPSQVLFYSSSCCLEVFKCCLELITPNH
jgi:hypothetical protein